MNGDYERTCKAGRAMPGPYEARYKNCRASPGWQAKAPAPHRLRRLAIGAQVTHLPHYGILKESSNGTVISAVLPGSIFTGSGVPGVLAYTPIEAPEGGGPDCPSYPPVGS